jgi:hypothetical protein
MEAAPGHTALFLATTWGRAALPPAVGKLACWLGGRTGCLSGESQLAEEAEDGREESRTCCFWSRSLPS